MDFKAMAKSLDIDEKDFFELVQLLVDTSHSDLKNLEQGLTMASNHKVIQAAHSIKGAAGNLGFTDISTMAAKIETLADQGKLDQIKAEAAIIQKALDSIKLTMDRSS